MKYTNLTFLLLIILSATFKNGVGYLSFKLNQEFIAKNLCVQKEIKNNCCQGKCHLAEQVQKNNNSDQAEAPIPFKIPELLYYLVQQQPAKWQLKEGELIFTSTLVNHVLNGFSVSIFHPPK